MFVLIGVIPECHLSVGLFDLRLGGLPGQSEHLIVIMKLRWLHVIREG